jgi:hypothetical protein
MADQNDKRTASQRIDDLENAMRAVYQTLDPMGRDLMTCKEAIKLLGNKADALAKAAGITDDVIGKLMIENNVAELKEKVTNLVAQGILVPSEELNDTAFIVGQEVDDSGAIVNPRAQFALGSIAPEVREKIKAGKIGEPLLLQEGKLRLLITEAYQIIPPQPPQAVAPVEQTAPVEVAPAQEAAQAPAEAPAEATPAEAAPAAAEPQSSDNTASTPAQSGN